MCDNFMMPMDDNNSDDSEVDENFTLDADDILEEIVLPNGDMEEDQSNNEEQNTAVVDQSKLTFNSHKAPVFCCDLHVPLSWVASGGEDDRVYVWDFKTGGVIEYIDSHIDTVIGVQFNHSGELLASADLSGLVMVHQLCPQNTKKLNRVWSTNVGDIVWTLWHPNLDIFTVGCEDGKLYVWRFPSGECKMLLANQMRCDSGIFTSQGKYILAGYNDSTIRLWDIKSANAIMTVNMAQYDVCRDNCVVVDSDSTGNIFAAGNDDGWIVICTRNGFQTKFRVEEASIECLAFSPSDDFRVLAYGTLEGFLHIFDFVKCILRLTFPKLPKNNDGYVRMKWTTKYVVTAVTVKGSVYGYDARNGNCMYHLTGHKDTIYHFTYNAAVSSILTASDDGTVKIFSIPALSDI